MAHEMLHRQQAVPVFITKRRGHLFLVLKDQLVIVATADIVQPVTDTGQHVPGGLKIPACLRLQHAGFFHVGKAGQAKYCLGRPEHGLDIAHPPLALLDVRFKQVGVTAVFTAPLPPQFFHGADKLVPVSIQHLFPISGQQLLVQRVRTGQQSGIQEGDLENKIVRGKADGIFHATNAVPDIKTGIPERVENGLRDLLHVFFCLPVMEQEQVHVGKGIQLAATVSPQGNKGN